MPAKTRYEDQRPKVTPPHVSLDSLRKATGKTLEQVVTEVNKITGGKLHKGTISGIERGHRGVSVELLRALERVYGLDEGSITTTYQPRASRSVAA